MNSCFEDQSSHRRCPRSKAAFSGDRGTIYLRVEDDAVMHSEQLQAVIGAVLRLDDSECLTQHCTALYSSLYR
jgi:hypothetical protein